MAVATATLIVAAMAGSKLYWILETGRDLTDLGGLWRGHRNVGALLAGVAMLPVAARLVRIPSSAALGDALTPAFCIALATVRIGCFLNGCCCGQSCDFPWAVRFPAGSDAWSQQVFDRLIQPSDPLSMPVHPLQIYLAIVGLLIGVTGIARIRSRQFNGEVFLYCVAAWGMVEAVMYGLRYQYSGGTHTVLVAIAVVAVLLLAVASRRQRGIPSTSGPIVE